MESFRSFISKVIYCLFIIIFSWIITNGIMFYDKILFLFNPFVVVLYVGVYIAFTFLLVKYALPSLAKFRYTPAVMLLIFSAVSYFCAYELRVNPSWDMGAAFDIAKAIGSKEAILSFYLHRFPNNIMITLIYSVVFRIANLLGLTGVMSYVSIATYFNTLFVIGTAVFIYLTAKELYGRKLGILALIILLLTTPLYMQTAIYYTDSSSMCLTTVTLYLLIKIFRCESKKRIAVLNLILGFIAFTAFEVKITSSILLIAAAIYAFLKKVSIKICKKYIIGVIVFAVLFTGYSYAKSIVFDEDIANYYKYPPEHWIMMGLNGVGGFSDSDYAYTDSFETYSEKQEADRKMIKERFTSYNPLTFTQHLLSKMKFSWADGTYYAPEKLRRDPVKDSFIHSFVLRDGEYTNYFKYIPQAMHMVMLIYAVTGIFNILKSKKHHGIELLFVTAILGITAFLLIWENRSRYVLTFVPIMMLLQIFGMKTCFNIKKE